MPAKFYLKYNIKKVIDMVDLSQETISNLFFRQVRDLTVNGKIGGEYPWKMKKYMNIVQ